jgi:hypothetical protein
MVAVAATALVLGIALTPGVAPVLGTVLIPSTILIICGFLAARSAIDLVMGYCCPTCNRRGLERRAVRSFGDRFYLCPACGTRCKRRVIGSFGMFFWSDASGPEYDDLYRKPPEEDPWNAPPGLEDEEFIYSKTHLNLVRNKRNRHPENPNGPGLG